MSQHRFLSGSPTDRSEQIPMRQVSGKPSQCRQRRSQICRLEFDNGWQFSDIEIFNSKIAWEATELVRLQKSKLFR
jgi:hypothetical protein